MLECLSISYLFDFYGNSQSIMNKIAISLNKNIECEYICQQIQKLVNKFANSQDLTTALLIIDIVQPTDGGDNHIPKLEYHPDSHT